MNLLTEHLATWIAADTSEKSARGRSAMASLYGVKKLRELILELAVRGLLVPQNPTDEPASELLKQIAAEKVRLVKEGKIKAQKPLAPIEDDEKPFDLPKGWEWVRLDDIGTTNIGLTYSPKDVSDTGVPVLRSSNIQRGKIDLDDLVRVNTEIKDSLFVENGDLLICARNGSKALVGKTAMIKDLREKMTFGAFMAIYKSNFNAYIEVFLNSPVFRNFLDDVNTTTINQITQNNLKTTFIPLPPLAEQQRIVAKVDELMALCEQLENQQNQSNQAHQQLVTTLLNGLTQSQSIIDFTQYWQRINSHFDVLFTTEDSIDALKQSILQLAVMGKLVAQNPTDEPASELLKRIAAEKARLVKEGKIKAQKPLAPIEDNEKPFDLPKGWEWVRLGDVSQLITSGSRDWAQYLSNDGAKFITMSNLSRGSYQLRLDNMRYVNPPSNGEGSRTKLEADDLVISITGDVGNLGRIPESFGDAYINQHACLVRFVTQCRNRYFSELLRSPMAVLQFNAPQRGVKNSFRLGDVGEMIVSLPPVDEQQRIVAKVDELMALCEQLKNQLNQAKHLQGKIADVLVEQALV